MAEHCSSGCGAGAGRGHRHRFPLAPGATGAAFTVLDANGSAQGARGRRGPSAGLGARGAPGCAGDLPVSSPLSPVLPGCSRRCRIDGERSGEVAFYTVSRISILTARPLGRRVRVSDVPAAPDGAVPAAPTPGGDAEPGPGSCSPPGVHLPPGAHPLQVFIPFSIPAQASFAVKLSRCWGKAGQGRGWHLASAPPPVRRVWSSQPSQARFFKVKKEEFPTRQKVVKGAIGKEALWMSG